MSESARVAYSNPKNRTWTGVTVFSAYLVLLMMEIYIEFYEKQSHLRVYRKLCDVFKFMSLSVQQNL